jgi:membrane associated rhomboid family serine protease
MLIPYKVDVPMSRRPIANYVIVGVTVAFFFLCARGVVSKGTIEAMTLGKSGWGWLGHLLLHGDLWHLAGNMIFLWVFGNAICAKIGNLYYLQLYLALGLAAAAGHMLFDGNPAVGASGAINGIVGVFLIWYPLNSISCFYWIFFRPGTFSVSSFWLILFWLAFDILGAMGGAGRIAYYAHLGGFVAGAGIGAALLLLGWVRMNYGEKSLLVVLGLAEELERPRRRYAYDTPAPAAGAAWGGRPPTDEQISAEPAPPAESAIKIQCRCGRSLMASRIHAGSQTRCPYCNTLLTIPGEDGEAAF